jgi:hypothetical protein
MTLTHTQIRHYDLRKIQEYGETANIASAQKSDNKEPKHGSKFLNLQREEKSLSVIAGSRLLTNLRRVQIRDPLAGAHKEGSQPLSEERKSAHAANARECTLTGTLFECRAYVLVHLLTRT